MSTNTDLDALLADTAAGVEARGGVSAEEVVSSEELASEQEPIVPDEPRDELERVEPQPTGPITLKSGLVVDVLPLRLRATMKLLRIVTHGAGRAGVLESAIGNLDLEDGEEFGQNLAALVLFALPEAEDESVEFIQSMVLPADYVNLDEDTRTDQLNKLAYELADPDLNDVVSIVERVIRRESEELRSLGKRISTAVKLTQKIEKKVAAK